MPDHYELLFALLHVTWIVFAFAFGACAGSLINVLVYRLPLGLDVVTPSSRCPSCDTKLTWRENIPVFGWLLLRGKCRFCKSKISPEYPIVEAFVGLVFAGLFALWFVVSSRDATWLGVPWHEMKPEWALNGFGKVWPAYVMTVVLLGSLVAMTLIDARTYQIPLVLCIVPMVLGVVGHTAHAIWIQSTIGELRHHAPDGQWWTIATPGSAGWGLLGATLGGAIGLGLSNALLAAGLIRRSYADYDEWERDALKKAGIDPEAAQAKPEHPAPRGSRWRAVLTTMVACAVLSVVGFLAVGALGGPPGLGVFLGLAAGPVVAGLALRRFRPDPTDAAEEASAPPDLWIQYPHARREACKEVVFLLPAVALAIVGVVVGQRLGGPITADPVTGQLFAATPIPLWASALSGAVAGLLIGGGVVWGIRILGSFAFGKEAMGLGDAWLMAAVGACLGWIDSTLAFFMAPFIALYVTLVSWAWAGAARRAMPYGPYLAGAVFVVVIGKVWVESGLGFLSGMTINIP